VSGEPSLGDGQFFLRMPLHFFFRFIKYISSFHKKHTMPPVEGSRVSFLMTFHTSSPILTHEMMESIGFEADEIVTSQDSAQIYAYLHLCRKVRGNELESGLQMLTSTHGLIINSQINLKESQNQASMFLHTGAEINPIMQTLISHERTGNRHFNRWVNPALSSKGSRGYEKLKTKLGLGKNDTINKGIYVLRLDNTPRPFFYVGKATNIALRIQQHQDGTGAYCITGKPFTRVDPVTKGSTDDMESWERNEVLTRMFEFGIDNVRGWMYTLKTMPEEQKISAFDQVCEKFDRCRKCGRGTHFVRDCQALSADLWTNGMELRTMYPQGAGAQTLLQLADAERRIAEAAKALMGRP